MQGLDAVLDKVRKLLALSGSDNPHEAAAAAGAASRLMEQYRIDTAQLGGGGPVSAARVHPVPVMEGKCVQKWRAHLLQGLAASSHCVMVLQRRRSKVGRSVTMHLLAGREQDIALVRQMYADLSVRIACLGKCVPARQRTSFTLGVVSGVIASLKLAQQAARTCADSTALVVVDRRDDEVNDLLKHVPTSHQKVKVDAYSFRHGERVGADLGAVDQAQAFARPKLEQAQ